MSRLIEVSEQWEVAEAESTQSFQSLAVMEFSSSCGAETVQWILSKITSPTDKGGCGLLTSNIMDESQKVSKVHLSASIETFLQGAEKMELKKMCADKEQGMREFTESGLKRGVFAFSDDLDSFLTSAEKQRIIKFKLESIRAPLSEEEHIPGTAICLYPGEAMLLRCQQEGLITDLYALHTRLETNQLSNKWIKTLYSHQPLDEIRTYFGESVAIYFAFLEFYTYFLIPPAVLGFVSQMFASQLTEDWAVALFCVFNLVWSTVFLESWKRKTAALAYQWGTIKMEQFEEPRAAFYGLSISKDPVTRRLQPQYPSRRRLLKFYLVSVPVMAAVLGIAFFIMLFYFWLDTTALNFTKYAELPDFITTLIMLLPTVIYALFITVINSVYRPLAVFLNNWENHRVQSAYDNHLVVKLLVFNFANCFMSLFYVAFYLQDFILLRQHLATLLITMQLVQQLQESLLPYLMYKWQKVEIVRRFYLDADFNKNNSISKVTLLYAERDAVRQPYDSTLEDYLELCLQFGYVFFFSAVYPTAAFWALMNNFIEIRSDAFKMCRTVKRPFSRPAANIGVWAVAFEVMSIVAVITNCALLALSPSVKDYWSIYGSVNVTLFFIAAEHVILVIKLAISYLIPDAPEWVETKLAADEYQAKFRYRLQTDHEDHIKVD